MRNNSYFLHHQKNCLNLQKDRTYKKFCIIKKNLNLQKWQKIEDTLSLRYLLIMISWLNKYFINWLWFVSIFLLTMLSFAKNLVCQLKTVGLLKGSLNTLCTLVLIIVALKETGLVYTLIKTFENNIYSSNIDLHYDNYSENI